MADGGRETLAGIKRLTLVNTAVLGVNVLLTLVLLVSQIGGDSDGDAGASIGTIPGSSGLTSAPTAPTAPTAPDTTVAPPTPGTNDTAAAPTTSGAAPPAPADGPERTAKFIEDTITPVKKAIGDMGGDASLLPTDDEVAAAKATGSLTSPESAAVIEKLKTAYGAHNMPFPTVPLPGVAPPAASGTTAPSATGATPSPPDAPAATSTDGSDQAILRAYFQVAISRIEREAKKKDMDVSDQLPDGAAVQAAVASGDIGSEASNAVLDTLRKVYEEVGVTFMEPAVQ